MKPEEEVELLLNEGIPFALEMLDKYGEFYPFALALDARGAPLQVQIDPGEQRPESTQVMALLQEAMEKGAASGDYKATALVVDVTLQGGEGGESTDAIQVGLEHSSGYCVNVFLPYGKDEKGEFTFGELLASPREGTVFSSPPQPEA